ncbi:S41 family peptidase [Sphingorhabdus sp. EL138]|uniref:S41 family peptidase n=1 Tax=Sphingorhabdus sp. EL138 TaxID=2073156 RepID=UPI000D68D384|nr:S41 family peptidase [Sphingorhabdus sp. EL138]
MIMQTLIISAAAMGVCAEERIAVVEIADAIETRYVLESNAKISAETLRRKNLLGTYDEHCEDGVAFADFLTRHLREVTGDKHFYVEFTAGPNNSDGEDWVAEWRKEAASNAFGVKHVERFEGNIAYLALSSFYEYEPAERALASAFELLSTSDAAIVDLRGNGGGSPETAWPIEWTFKEANNPIQRKMETRVSEPEKLEEPSLSWPRYGAKRPLVILMNKSSFSASEAVAYGLQAEGRAIIIGERSGGGAHMLGDGVSVTGGWKIGIPETRPVNRITGTNWEDEGVVPDVEVSSDKALARALVYLRGKLSN